MVNVPAVKRLRCFDTRPDPARDSEQAVDLQEATSEPGIRIA